ncbi:nuclear transport factor 2 family protein [uncultured Phenylobacterium sp.]|uniref:YybH family protein n=1 Tax=uncultured Phenylobacterium sp. TaxID=349273 RepID=UPI0025CCAFE5|nr:nuclear transport factor 2 family protein [uncultured Phenylobacterium sp.]
MKISLALRAVILAATLLTAAGASAHPQAEAERTPASSAPAASPEAAKVIDDFHAALASGDTTAAASLLTDAAIIYEAGGVERSKAEYVKAHLPGDAAFAKAVGQDLVRRNGGTAGDMAWVASEGRTKGKFKGRDVDRLTTETMILRRVAGTWRIVHIHWSSRAATAVH